VGRILDNLVNNALTYTMDQPWVRVTVTPDGVVTVEDHGLGIPEDRRGLVFERFFRVNDPSLPPQPGTGLGLYISRELARRYGGDVALENSAPGAGSRFMLRLQPAVRALRGRAAEAAPAGSRRAG
jgi:signal transduction histidine kinase